ncbi:MAG: class I SAM-dependent methyltransferase [Anaerolineae bacterium]|nr:class I SAM-dependent methyltransferase [Anaerolineae bacterium]
MSEPSPGCERLNACHRATYDGVAARYAEVNAALPEAVAASARQFVALLGGTGRVLELGCGHGRDVAWFEARGLTVVGADLSIGMLREADSIVEGPLVQLDMRQLAFRAGAFDGIWSNAAVIHIPKAAVWSVLAEVRRVLVPGGWFFVSIQVGRAEVWEAQSYGQPLRRFFVRYDPADFAKMLRQAGFRLLAQGENSGGPNRHWAHYFARSCVADDLRPADQG